MARRLHPVDWRLRQDASAIRSVAQASTHAFLPNNPGPDRGPTLFDRQGLHLALGPRRFWATDQKNLFGAILLNPSFRRTLGPAVLRSDRLLKIGKFRNRLRKKGLASRLFMEKKRLEALIQDAAIPVDAVVEFDAWLADKLQIYPLWYCPVKTLAPSGTYPLYRPRSEFVVDFGFYLSAELEDHMDPYYHNRSIEEKLLEVGGFKCLYSDTFFNQEQFWSMYDRRAYEQVKAKYDPHNTYLDVYTKVISSD